MVALAEFHPIDGLYDFIAVPRQVYHVYLRQGDDKSQLHDVKQAIRWYKRALFAACPSSSKNIDLLPEVLCKIASGYISIR